MSGPVGTIDTVDASNIVNIENAIVYVATHNVLTGVTDPTSGLPVAYKGSCRFGYPTPQEVKTASGFPFFCVSYPQRANYYDYLSGESGGRFSRPGSQVDRLLGWDYTIRTLIDLTPTTAKTHDMPLAYQILINTEQTFIRNFLLPGSDGNITCEKTEVYFPEKPVQPIMFDGQAAIEIVLGLTVYEAQRNTGYESSGWTS